MNKQYKDYLKENADQIEQSMSRFSVSKTGKPKLKSVFSPNYKEKKHVWTPFHINNEPVRRIEAEKTRFFNDLYQRRRPA